MKTKICNKCNDEKDILEFRQKKTKFEYKPYYICKKCEKDEKKKYAEKEKINSKTRYYNNIEKCRSKGREQYYAHKEKRLLYKKEWVKKNKEHVKNYNKKWQTDHPEYKIIYKNKNKKEKTVRIYTESEILNKKIASKLRKILFKKLNNKNIIKSNATKELIGCDFETVRTHLGITGTYDSSKYHIDHIIPCAAYDLTKEEEQKKCFNYKNLRLISSFDNLRKSDKLDIDLVKSYNIEHLLPGEINV